jgi:hypothetical protein
VEKTGKKRPWKSLWDFHFSHSFNNNKLDDRDHFLQNAQSSVASLRRLITPIRDADHDQPGTLITFIGIRIKDAHFRFLGGGTTFLWLTLTKIRDGFGGLP